MWVYEWDGHIMSYRVGWLLDGRVVTQEVYKEKELARRAVHYLNGGSNGY